MTALAEVKQNTIRIERADLAAPVLFTMGGTDLSIRAGTVIDIDGRKHAFETDTPIKIGELAVGRDYGVGMYADGNPFAAILGPSNPLVDGWFAGFHYAPGSNAAARSGGDATPAINPFSLWDIDFRPSCPDPRGMALVDMPGHRFWADIYLLGADHDEYGTSWCGATIADGRDLPARPDGKGRYKKLNYAAASEIVAHHGKRLLGAEEFFAAAYGVEERCSRDDEPTTTGALMDRAERFISKWGIFDATGTMWQWGTDGDPDNPRPSIFGGSWIYGSNAGSRYANLDYWPENSSEDIGARACCDHLSPA